MKLLSHKRLAIPQNLIARIKRIPDDCCLIVYWDEGSKSIIFSDEDKGGAIVQIGSIHLDYKNRFFLSGALLDLIPKLLQADSFEQLYLGVNSSKELCIKKVP